MGNETQSAEQNEPAVVKFAGPAFEPGMRIVVPTLVTDYNGVSWWIDPSLQTIRRVTHGT